MCGRRNLSRGDIEIGLQRELLDHLVDLCDRRECDSEVGLQFEALQERSHRVGNALAVEGEVGGFRTFGDQDISADVDGVQHIYNTIHDFADGSGNRGNIINNGIHDFANGGGNRASIDGDGGRGADIEKVTGHKLSTRLSRHAAAGIGVGLVAGATAVDDTLTCLAAEGDGAGGREDVAITSNGATVGLGFPRVLLDTSTTYK